MAATLTVLTLTEVTVAVTVTAGHVEPESSPPPGVPLVEVTGPLLGPLGPLGVAGSPTTVVVVVSVVVTDETLTTVVASAGTPHSSKLWPWMEVSRCV
jgi:hypothetical protein